MGFTGKKQSVIGNGCWTTEYEQWLEAKVVRLRRLVRETRQLQLGWEVADAFDYEEQSSGECQTFVAAFNAITEAMIANTEEEQTRCESKYKTET